MRQATDSRSTQRGRILALLIAAHGDWGPLQKILELKISQFGARIHELRHERGFPIENRTEVVNGTKHSCYRLQIGPGGLRPEAPVQSTAASSDSLFGDIAQLPDYPD
jgi:hypothetical protein